jgi:hypothetical protein
MFFNTLAEKLFDISVNHCESRQPTAHAPRGELDSSPRGVRDLWLEHRPIGFLLWVSCDPPSHGDVSTDHLSSSPAQRYIE